MLSVSDPPCALQSRLALASSSPQPAVRSVHNTKTCESATSTHKGSTCPLRSPGTAYGDSDAPDMPQRAAMYSMSSNQERSLPALLGEAPLSQLRFEGDARIADSRYMASAGKSVVWRCTSQSLAFNVNWR